ncbi:hypothetical protein B0A48_08796 [Cryoendolithus antarcticus]|uniref:Uncharacterized protein n=1 Tax=Cryoendolithus antarcticus TaxID=1507870 RepID=A0A1V8T4R5_9PEZI|nr:hypothetical protein B0A48_08796 [Cryoendolithus antarcticus]
MFAPPPAGHLSRAEIQARRARLQAQRASEDGNSNKSATTLERIDSQPGSPKSDKKRRPFSANKKDVEEIRVGEAEQWKLFGRKGKGKEKGKTGSDGASITSLSPPSTLLLPPPPTPPMGSSVHGSDEGSVMEVKEDEVSEPGMRAEMPTGKAKAAPRRPSRPGELVLPPSALVPGALPTTPSPGSLRATAASTPPLARSPSRAPRTASPAISARSLPTSAPSSPPPAQSPPPIPLKSPLREPKVTRPASQPTPNVVKAPMKKQVSPVDGAISVAMADLSIKDQTPIQVAAGEHRPTRALQRSSGQSFRPLSPTRLSPTYDKLRTIDKPVFKRRSYVAKRSISSSAVRAAMLDLGTQQSLIRPSTTPSTGNANAIPRRMRTVKAIHPRRGPGENLAMLQTSGFFSKPEVIDSASTRIFIDKDLPDTPSSIAPTPTVMYQSPRNSQQSVRSRKSGNIGARSPLSQIAEGSVKNNSVPIHEEVTPTSAHRLTTILEFVSLSENTPPPSGTATLLPTQIHLRGGSIVTVSPPELTAWQRSVYLQGAIKLPKPAILPRKNSVASMEPFQDAIDRVYQSALFVPRRRSDDAIVDDICEFFDDFGFDDVEFGGDFLQPIEEVDVTEVDGMDVDDPGRKGSEVERFSTPPGFASAAEVTPVERLVAKDVVKTTMSLPAIYVPPVETEETLRARGIVRLSQQANRKNSQFSSRKPSVSRLQGRDSVMPEHDSSLHLQPQPEQSMLDVVQEDEAPMGWANEMEGHIGGMDWDDDVEETDAGASWTAPAAMMHRKHALNRGLVGKDKRNPMAKMRRAFATATTIL